MRIRSDKDAKLMVYVMIIGLSLASAIMYFGCSFPLWYVALIIVPLLILLVVPTRL